jgi:Gnt-I system low-affinity gluconate transporter
MMQGSATVAMLAGAGLISAMLGQLVLPQALLALHVIAIAAGATIASHVNDSGFWLVNRYLGLTVPETFKTWTALTTIAALVAIVLVMFVSLVL